MTHFANFVVRDKYVLIVLKMHDHVIYLIIKAIENNKFSKAIAIIEVLQEEQRHDRHRELPERQQHERRELEHRQDVLVHENDRQ